MPQYLPQRVIKPMTPSEQEVAAKRPIPRIGSVEQPPQASQIHDSEFTLFFGPPPQARNYQGSKTPAFRPAQQRYNEMKAEFDRNIALFVPEGGVYKSVVLGKNSPVPTPAQLRAFDACKAFCKIFSSHGILCHRPTKNAETGLGYNYWLALTDAYLMKADEQHGAIWSLTDNRPLLVPMDPHFITPDGIDETAISIIVRWISKGIPVYVNDMGKFPQSIQERNALLLDELAADELEPDPETGEVPDLFAGF